MISNETTYNYENISDAAKILTKKYRAIVAATVGLLVIIACYLALSGDSVLVIIPIVGLIFCVTVGTIRILSYKKMLLQRLQVLNHQNEVKCYYEIDNEKMTVTSPNGVNTLYHKDMKKFYETKSIYLMIYMGGVFTIITKDGFRGNTEIEFRKMIGRA